MKETNIIQYGKYKGYELCYTNVYYTNGRKIFSRAGWYLLKTSKNGKVKDILYLEDALPKK